jgi:hypothetical protein
VMNSIAYAYFNGAKVFKATRESSNAALAFSISFVLIRKASSR